MAYTEEQIIIFPISKEKEVYRSENARKVNASKKPNGYIYILQNKYFDLVKVGVSSIPKRRIRDIKSYTPFDLDIIFLKYYKDVYSLESIIHESIRKTKVKGEWHQMYKEDVDNLINILNTL